MLQVYGSGEGRFDLYQDDGISLDYRKGQYALTPVDYTTHGGLHRVVIGPTRGAYHGQLPQRGYALSIHARQRPEALAVDGHGVAGLHWNPARRLAQIELPRSSIRDAVVVTCR